MNILAEIFPPIFVYGSLKKGEEASHKLDDCKFLGKAYTAPKYKLYDLNGYVGLAKGKEKVMGELYKVTLSKLKDLDEWEYDVYDRVLIDLDDGSKAFAFMLKSSSRRNDE
jgi:gamma-glutamylcyclotransferase (GGCT)/AIG2-like uncharacterized protein YtfP